MAYTLDADTTAKLAEVGGTPMSDWVPEKNAAGKLTAGHVVCHEGVLYYSYAENTWTWLPKE